MTLTTVKDYCTQRGVSRQFVYEYIRKGKFELLTLPVFTEFNGERVSVGKQKFINVPPQYFPLEDDATYAETMAESATSDSELQLEIQAMFMIADEKEALKFRHKLEKKYAAPHPKAKAFASAQKKMHQAMLDEMADIENNLAQLEANVDRLSEAKLELNH
jgi:hypothetical protein